MRIRDRERRTAAHISKMLSEEPCLTPGAHFETHVTRTGISVKIELLTDMTLNDRALELAEPDLHGYLQQYLRHLLVVSGYHDLPCPEMSVLMPLHPDDSNAARIIRDAAQLLKSKLASPQSGEHLQSMRAALEPFAKAADDYEDDPTKINYADDVWDALGIVIKVGDLRRARKAINAMRAQEKPDV